MTQAPDPTPVAPRGQGLLSGGRAGALALIVSVVALIAALAPYASGGGFDGKVRAYMLSHPEILQEASRALDQKEQQGQADVVSRHAAANPGLLAVDATDPSFGPVDARVTVIEFFDFRCPGCKATAPEVLRIMQAHPEVRFVFMDWPILDRNGDAVSHYAARAAQAAHQQGKYLPVFRALMAEPALTEAAVDRVLVANGVTLPGAREVMKSPQTARHLASIHANAMALQLYGTPTFFVNGKAQSTIQPADLERAIQAAKAA